MKDIKRVRRKYNPKQVEDLVESKETELKEAQKRIDSLNSDLESTLEQLEQYKNLDEDTLTELLGTSAARLMNAARKEAELKEKEAETEAEEILSQAKREAEEIHSQAELAFRERIEAAKAEAEKLEAEAESIRHRTLIEMNRERKEAKAEVHRLKAGRDKLLNSVDLSQKLIDEIKDDLTHSLSEAKIAADAAARRVLSQPDPTPAEIEEEIAAAKLLEIPSSYTSPAPEPTAELDEQQDSVNEDSGSEITEDALEVETGDDATELIEHTEVEEQVEEHKKSRKLFQRKPRELHETQEVLETSVIEDFQITQIVPEEAVVEEAVIEEVPLEEAPSEADSTESLFERLKAEQESEKERAPVVEVPTIDLPPSTDWEAAAIAEETQELPEETSEEEEVIEDASENALEEDTLEALAKIFERQLKQAMALDQNQVLDLLRQRRKKELPPIESQTDVYIAALNTEELTEIADLEIDVPKALLLEQWVQPLRYNLENCFPQKTEGSDSEESDTDIPKAIRDSYRNFKQTECSKIALELSKKVLEITSTKEMTSTK